MKKKLMMLVTAACILCLSFALIGCSGNDDKSNESNEGNDSNAPTEERTTFTVGFDQDFPPYGYVGDDGQHTGFDLDLAAEVAQRNNWEVKYSPINWDAKDLELSSGSIDCIWNGFTIEGRETQYTFTDPYMDNTQVVVVKAESGIQKLSDLEGKNVMAQLDSAAMHLLEEGGDRADLADTFAELRGVPEYNSAFMELESGAVDAVAIDFPVAKFQIVDRGDEFVILEEELSSEHYGVGFLLGETELRDVVQQTLKEMVADGTVEELCKKYEDQGISFDMWCLEA